MPSMFLRIFTQSLSPLLAPRGRSICVISPVITIFELKPSLVKNIFICSPVVFWASSRIIKLSSSVLPLIYASGATSILPRSTYFW